MTPQEINDGGCAIPCQPLNAQGEPMGPADCGMTLRDWFAGQALESDIQHHRQFIQYDAPYGEKRLPAKPKFTREQARYLYADAMIEARSKAKGGES